MDYIFSKRFVLLLGFLLSCLLSPLANASSIIPMRPSVASKQGGAEPLPQSKPGDLAVRFGDYVSGKWRIVGSSVDGKKLFSGKINVQPVSDKKFLRINYNTKRYSSLGSDSMKTVSRRAFMVLYFSNEDHFNLLSFRDSGKIKHFQGGVSFTAKKYRFTIDSFKFGPLRAQVVAIIKPINNRKYLEHFYMNILMPGSSKVMQHKLIANMVATKMRASHKGKHKEIQRKNHSKKNKSHEKIKKHNSSKKQSKT